MSDKNAIPDKKTHLIYLVIIIISLLVIFTISYVGFMYQEDFLYQTILPKGYYIKLVFGCWILAAVITFLCLKILFRQKKPPIPKEIIESKPKLRWELRILEWIPNLVILPIISIIFGVILLSPLFSLTLKINMMNPTKETLMTTYKIIDYEIANTKGRRISPNYTRLYIITDKGASQKELYLEPDFYNRIKEQPSIVKITYYKGILGWDVKKDLKFHASPRPIKNLNELY